MANLNTDYSKQAEVITAWYANKFPGLTVTNVTVTGEGVALADDAIGFTQFCVGFAQTNAPHIMSTNAWICKGPEDTAPIPLAEWIKMRLTTRPWRN